MLALQGRIRLMQVPMLVYLVVLAVSQRLLLRSRPTHADTALYTPIPIQEAHLQVPAYVRVDTMTQEQVWSYRRRIDRSVPLTKINLIFESMHTHRLFQVHTQRDGIHK